MSKKKAKEKWIKAIDASYTSVISNKDQTKQFLGLLGRGYFPRELPPPFNTQSFSMAVKKRPEEFKNIISDNLFDKQARSGNYSLARPGQLRRVLGIPNPAFQLLISLKLSDIFDTMDIDFLLNSPDYSMSFPVFEGDDRNRAFEFSHSWDDVPTRRLKERANGKFVVKADIARFFPSIYTHSIPWAFHGKKLSKENKHDLSLEGNVLDLLIRNSQDGQTLGIPIGPDTSFIISEKILFEIDRFIKEKIKNSSIRCFHRVDNYEFVCMTRQQADFCIAVLQEALQNYELELNTLKTEVLQLPQPIQDLDIATLRSFDLGNTPIRTRLLEYYDLAFECYKKYPKGTLKYSIKRIPTEDYYDDTIINFMSQSMLLEPGVIDAVFTWLTKADCLDKVNKETFSLCLSNIIQEHSILGHTSEVAWAIWGFMLLKEQIPLEATKSIVKMNDAVVLLLALDARKKGLLKSKDLLVHIHSFMTSDQLYGPYWLLAYEAVKQGWVSPTNSAHVDNDPIFSLFKKRKVSFYESQDIEDYQTLMKEWQPYNPYVPDPNDLSDLITFSDDDEYPF